jgi:hypothetical protein
VLPLRYRERHEYRFQLNLLIKYSSAQAQGQAPVALARLMSLLQSSAELLKRSQAGRMRPRGTFFLDPQAFCSIFVRYCSTIMMICSSCSRYSLSRLSLLPTVLPAEGATTASTSRCLRFLLRSLSCQHHLRGQLSA